MLQKDVYSSIIYTTTELGKGESPELNLASRSKLLLLLNLIWINSLLVVLSMVKAILLEVYYSLSFSIGIYLVRDGIYKLLQKLNDGFWRWGSFTRFTLSKFKNKSRQPKESIRMRSTTSGLPKGSNSYGNRAIIVPVWAMANTVANRGRIAAIPALTSRSYSTGCANDQESIITKKLRDLYIRSKDNPEKVIDRDLYKILCRTDILEMAYDKLKSNPGQMTPGVNPETLDGMSHMVLETMVEELKSESFEFQPGRRVQIPKASGGTRPLTVASPRDKLVQEAMRMILEAVYEPTFSDNSHGFRPQRSCHSALKTVKQQFQPVNWIIEGDKSKCFDSIDHHKLMSLIEGKIKDRKFTRLIWKSLKAGYFEFKVYHNNISGTPQGSIISPLLTNIFMSQLDSYVEELKKDFDKGTKSRVSPVANSYHHLITKAKREGKMGEVVKLAKESRKTAWADFADPGLKRLSYVRYAGDWVLGIKGTYEEAVEIFNKIDQRLSEVGLTLSKSKTKITNINEQEITFLGTTIFRARKTSSTKMSHATQGYLKRNSKKLRLEAPLVRILKKLHEADFMKEGKSAPKFIWLSLEHRQILHMYNSVLRGYLNYYKFSPNYGSLVSTMVFILKSSCAKLLAAKYSLGTMSKTFAKFGPELPAPDSKGKRTDPKGIKA
jgi:group II intron reverse transcriptase/maturase